MRSHHLAARKTWGGGCRILDPSTLTGLGHRCIIGLTGAPSLSTPAWGSQKHSEELGAAFSP